MERRVIIIVLDSVGIGAAPDASSYGDTGADTLGHVAGKADRLELPNLEALGLGHIDGVTYLARVSRPIGSYARLNPQSAGKDTTTGHWELAGLVMDEPFTTYPNGFPADLVQTCEKAIGRSFIGNCVASGTEIIKQLGQEHVNSGKPILYTSADSVFQIAAHEAVISPDQLYEICRIVRNLLTGRHAVGRVIARPFIGADPDWKRTANRKDFSLEPVGKTLLDLVVAAGQEVRAIGKIKDIFAGRGITGSYPTKNNAAGIKAVIEQLDNRFSGLLFANLVDFDMLYGHRNDLNGYAAALMAFDQELPHILAGIRPDDLLLITADHGCDPAFPGTDHTREDVPLLIYNPSMPGSNLGTRKGFAHVASTAAAWLQLTSPSAHTPLLAGMRS